MKKAAIPTYVINLKIRTDRKLHIEKEFANRKEFCLRFIDAVKHPIGAIGLWKSMKLAVKEALEEQYEYIVICEDDHQFTSSYSKGSLEEAIEYAYTHEAEVLHGGVSAFDFAVQVSDQLFWVKDFNGTQFLVIFKSLYQKIMDADFNSNDTADGKLSALSTSTLVIYPFSSSQKEFGYSDILTAEHQRYYAVDKLFDNAQSKLAQLYSVFKYYNLGATTNEDRTNQVDESYMPLYVIYPEKADLRPIELQLKDRSEFVPTFISTSNHLPHDLSFWQGLVEAVKHALDNDDDVIAVCTNNHQFSSYYSSTTFFKYVLNAWKSDSEILLLDIGVFGQAVPVSRGLFWINSFLQFEFVIIFKSLFEKIASLKFDESDRVEKKLNELANFVFAIHPFLSVSNNQTIKGGNLMDTFRSVTDIRLKTISFVRNKFSGTPSPNTSQLNKLLEDYAKNKSHYFNAIKQYLAIRKRTSLDVKFVSHIANKQNLNKNKIVVLVPFYNVENYISYCASSIFKQDYGNFSVLFLDDCSTDQTLYQIPEGRDCTILSSKNRSYALFNLYHCLSTYDFSDDDIIVIIDGDDYLRHNQVFRAIDNIYTKQKCLLTYGQYVTTNNTKGHCRPYSKSEFENLRNLDWRASHLKSFKYSLFREFMAQDPSVRSYKDQEGRFFRMTYDIALMTPLLEIAGFRQVYYNSDIFYVYRLHENNDAVINLNLQMSIAEEIMHRKKFNQTYKDSFHL